METQRQYGGNSRESILHRKRRGENSQRVLLSNFSEMRLSGGAAGYELGFGGTLSRDAKAKVEAGLSGVEIEIPASTAARVIAETTLGSVDVGDGFTEREGALLTEGALSGDAPVLTIRAGVRLGSLQLRAR